MKTKIHTMLMLVAIATAAPAIGGGITGSHLKVNGFHMPPISAPQEGGLPGPNCLPGGQQCQ